MAAGIAAICRRDLQGVIVIDVAGGAGDVGVAVGEGKTGGGVIKDRGVPGNGVVAPGAIAHGKGRTGVGMYWVDGLLPGRQVAARISAIGGRDFQIVIVSDVAGLAWQIGVAVGQEKASDGVIEFGVGPGIEGVAAIARGRKISSLVIGISSFLEIA